VRDAGGRKYKIWENGVCEVFNYDHSMCGCAFTLLQVIVILMMGYRVKFLFFIFINEITKITYLD